MRLVNAYWSADGTVFACCSRVAGYNSKPWLDNKVPIPEAIFAYAYDFSKGLLLTPVDKEPTEALKGSEKVDALLRKRGGKVLAYKRDDLQWTHIRMSKWRKYQQQITATPSLQQ